MAMREDVYDILPFVLTVANETFESQKLAKLGTLPGRGSTDFSNFTEETMTLQRQGDLLTPDTLRLVFWICKFKLTSKKINTRLIQVYPNPFKNFLIHFQVSATGPVSPGC